MNVNVYLPDDLGKRAKDADIPFSQLLRDAVVIELERRDAMTATLSDAQTIKLDLIDKDGNLYTGRFTGSLIAGDDKHEVYLAEDGRVIFFECYDGTYSIVDDPENDLSDWPEALQALGIKPVIDI